MAKNNPYKIKVKGKMITIKPKNGDTLLSEIEYGKTCYPVINGVVLRRQFDVLYCKNENCGKQILARFVPYKGSYALIPSYRHNDSQFCGSDCMNKQRKINAKRNKGNYKAHSKTKPAFGYPKTKWTKDQQNKFNSYVASL